MFLGRKRKRIFPPAFLRRITVLALSGMLFPLMALCPAAESLCSGLGATDPAVTAQTAAPGLAYQHIPGERLVYRLDYLSSSVSDLQVLFEGMDSPGTSGEVVQSGLSQSFNTTAQGDLAITVLDRKADRILTTYRLLRPQVTLVANGQEALSQAETIRAALSQVIFAETSSRGRVLSVRFDPAIDNFSQNFARSLLAPIQFVLPDARATGSRQWEVQEDDPNGQYVARYEAEHSAREQGSGESQTGLKTFRKTKIRYLTPHQKTRPGKLQVFTTIKPEGSLVARFDVGGGHLYSFRGTEGQIIIMAGKTVARAQITLQLEFLRKETLTAEELTAIRDASVARNMVARAVPLSATISKQEREAIIQRSELGQETLESLVAQLAKAESEGKRRDTPLYLKFKALVYLHPETSSSLGKLLYTVHPQSLTMRILTGALSAAGHPQAQEALVNVIRARPNDSTALLTLVKGLGSVESPTMLSEKTLRDLAANAPDWDVATSAQLALGTMARNLADTSPERAAKIVEWAINKINSSTSEDETRLFLLVLGNAGSIHALPTITRFVVAPSPAVRSTAVLALRWIESSKADLLLAKSLSSDPDPAVRLEATFALSFREPTPTTFQAQKTAFLGDEAVMVRLAALENLWNVHKSFPEVRQLVKQSATNDPSKEVRKAAAEIMAMYPKDYFDE
ncbi:MAG: HEAT repeat domain-containing protein [Deltaproteobacteria bacterium]|nr:HEAT repeat domain-containing protein [Deltaproteobacteria bacterium]